MPILFDLAWSNGVTDFSDIRASYAKFKEAQNKYWDDLQDKAWRLALGFEEHLGLKGQQYAVPGKGNEPYFQVGVMDKGDFKPVHGPAFAGDDLKVQFVIKLVLDEAPNVFPKKGLLLKAAIGKKDGGYIVIIDGRSGHIGVLVPSTFAAQDVAQVYEVMAQEIIGNMDTSIFE